MSLGREAVGPAAIVLGIGLERLMSAFMSGGLAPYRSVRLFVGVACTATAVALFTLATVTRFRSRRRRP